MWITYRLARDLVSAGERQEADALMRAMVNRQPQDAERVYASGLYLSGNDQDDLALAQIAALPRSAWTDNIRELEARLQSDRGAAPGQPAARQRVTKRRRSPLSNSSPTRCAMT
ncbi:cellulose synthase operon protein C [Klebsiella aerogenes]|nr:cellulose synthase operon protein C [Klebsiella aerogenes]